MKDFSLFQFFTFLTYGGCVFNEEEKWIEFKYTEETENFPRTLVILEHEFLRNNNQLILCDSVDFEVFPDLALLMI